jgi:hypothetical protein
MPEPIASGAGPEFGAHDYEILFRPLTMPREANIRAIAAAPLRVGDVYTIGRAGRLYDLVVQEISRQKSGHWNARCEVSDWP